MSFTPNSFSWLSLFRKALHCHSEHVIPSRAEERTATMQRMPWFDSAHHDMLEPHPDSSGNRSAFTLIELILYVAISSMVVVAMMNILMTIVSTRQKSSVGSSVQQNLRFAMDRITLSTHQALALNTGTSTFGSDNGVLSLTMTGGTAAVTPMIYTLCNGHICAKIGNKPTFVITGSGVLVDQFRITNLTSVGAPATIKVQMHGKETVVGATNQNTASFSLETSISLRQ